MKLAKPVTLVAALALTMPLAYTAFAQADASERSAGAHSQRDHGGRHMRASFRKGQRGGGMFGQMMQEVDADQNGAITQAEIDTYRSQVVSEADSSGDGTLSLDEFETIYAKLMRARMVDAFQDLDDDGDGAITQAELDDRFGRIVERMDRNGDGALSRDDRRGGKRD